MIAAAVRCSLIAALLALFPAPARAQDDVPSCYASVQIGVAPAPPGRAVFVLVDQTTAFDAALRQSLIDNVGRLVRPGTSFAIASFSALGPGQYPTVIAAGTLEAPLSRDQRLHASAPRLRQLDACLTQQARFGQQRALGALRQALATSGASFTRSEIMTSLQQLAVRVAATRVRDRIVLVASDMLEHSSVTSFYRARGLRPINPHEEMQKAARHRQLANFNGARLWVLGAGLLPPQPGNRAAGRDIPALNALEDFWTNWFRQSRAQLVVFGRPSLVVPIE